MANVILNADNGLPMLEQAGEYRSLGALPHVGPKLFGAYADYFPVKPRSQWKPTSHRQWANWARRDQHMSSCCTGYSSTTALRYKRVLAGMKDVLLSPFFVYGLINHGQDRGASVHDTLTVLESKGACRNELMPELQKGTYQARQYTQAQYNDARRFKVVRALALANFDELGSALTDGHLCVIGTAVGRNFQEMHGSGVCPLPDTVVGGHALPLLGLDSKGRFNWCTEFENSWTAAWGDNGFGWLQEGMFDPKYGFPFDGYVLLDVSDDPQATQTPPLS